MPDNMNTSFLDPSIRNNSYRNKRFSERPIDICFIGHINEYRGDFFAKHASFFAKYNCYFFFNDPTKIVIAGKNGNLDTQTTMSILQRSKILLNIHHSKNKYFEWHRIVTHGITNKNLVITDPVTSAPPFVEEKDFIVCGPSDWEETIDKFLINKDGADKAQTIIDSAYIRLINDCKMSDRLAVLIENLFII